MVKVIHHLKQKLYARQESLFWNGGGVRYQFLTGG